MDINELKKEVEVRTGVPAPLLTGETSEEVIAKAKALLAFKRETEQSAPQSTAQQFASWLNKLGGIEEVDEARQALADLEDSLRAYSYRITDNGSPYINGAQLPEGRSTAEQFAEYMENKLAYDPFKDKDGWKKLGL